MMMVRGMENGGRVLERNRNVKSFLRKILTRAINEIIKSCSEINRYKGYNRDITGYT